MRRSDILWLGAYLLVMVVGGFWTIEPQNRVPYFLLVLPLGTLVWLLFHWRRSQNHGH